MTLADNWLVTLGIASIVVSNVACLPYIRDMLCGSTRPVRSTWLIWSVLSGICLMSNVDKGADASLFFVGVETAETVLIFALSIRFGMGSILNARDLAIYAVAGGGLALWWVTDDAVFALAIAIAISALGGVPTILKAYAEPRTETAACWGLSALAALLGLLSVGAFTPVLLAYPAYLLVLYCAILGAMSLGYRRERLEREAMALRLAPLRPRAMQGIPA
jgi:hypothetical protein